MNWSDAIHQLIRLHQHIRDMDQEGLWENELPHAPARADDVRRVEERIGSELDAGYRDFLSSADGWRAFYQWVDLFGTQDLLGEPMRRAQRRLDDLEGAGVLPRSGLSRADIVPIAMTREGQGTKTPDLFMIVRRPNKNAGAVVWFGDEEIDRFSTFHEFYLAMLDYNRREIADLSKEARDKGRLM